MTYKLTNKAAADYARLYQYGIENFGYEQAEYYAEGMEKRFEAIGNSPFCIPSLTNIWRDAAVVCTACIRSITDRAKLVLKLCE